jgi:hypothetical protein
MARVTRDELAHQLTEVQKSLASLTEKHEEFRRAVYEAAKGAKEENGWCDGGFERAIRDLGLADVAKAARGNTRRRITMVLDFDMDDYDQDVNLTDFKDDNWVDSALEYIRDNMIYSYELGNYTVEELPE